MARCPNCDTENKDNAPVCSMCKEPLSSGYAMEDEFEQTQPKALQKKKESALKKHFLVIVLMGLLFFLAWFHLFASPQLKRDLFDKMLTGIIKQKNIVTKSSRAEHVPTDEEIQAISDKRKCKQSMLGLAKDMVKSRESSVDELIFDVDPICPADNRSEYKLKGQRSTDFEIFCPYHKHYVLYKKKDNEVIFSER